MYILAALVVDVELALLDMSNLNAAVVALSEPWGRLVNPKRVLMAHIP